MFQLNTDQPVNFCLRIAHGHLARELSLAFALSGLLQATVPTVASSAIVPGLFGP